jgi:hypothetical protein
MCDEIITVKPDLVFTEKGVSGKVIIFPQYMLLVHSLAVQTQTTTAYCRHWTTMFEISLSGSSDTNHGSLL